LEQLRRPALLDRRRAVDDEVLEQAGRADRAALERERDARVAADVLELALVRVQVRGEQVVAVDRDPDQRDLGSAARADRREMAERP
jgi:hypothetical protein